MYVDALSLAMTRVSVCPSVHADTRGPQILCAPRKRGKAVVPSSSLYSPVEHHTTEAKTIHADVGNRLRL